MSAKAPRNLILTKAYLTDKPYEVQIAVLRWVKHLVGSLVDAAVDQARREAEDHECCKEDSLFDMGTLGRCQREAESIMEFTADGSSGSNSCHDQTCADFLCSVPSANGSSVTPVNSTCEQKRRKRPRTHPSGGDNRYAIGDVVECYYTEDGLWYPAEITGVRDIAVPGAAENEARPDCGENDGGKEDICLSSLAMQDELVQMVGRREDQAAKKIDVTFLGYGNEATVPTDWIKQVSSPEVLKWCTENGVATGQLKSPILDADGEVSFAELLSVNVSEQETSGENDAGAQAEESKRKGKNQGQHGQKHKKASKGNKKKKKKAPGTGKTAGQDEGTLAGDPLLVDENLVKKWGPRSRSPLPGVPSKYWGQRYRYFSKYDAGVSMDKEGWYSVTPEVTARHIAERMQCDVVVDPFVGCGGNAIQCALVCHMVIVIDLDPVKLEHARRNAVIYGVENRIEFILGDAMKVLPTLKADAVFLSPPWGGPAYQDSKTFNLNTMLPAPLNGLDIFRAAREVSPNVAFYLPRNVDIKQVAGLPRAIATSSTAKSETVSQDAKDEPCEFEQQFLNGKLKTVTAYFGKDIVAEEENSPSKAANVSNAGDEVSPGNDAELAGSTRSIVAWTGRHVRFNDIEDVEDDNDNEEEPGNDAEEVVAHKEESKCSSLDTTRGILSGESAPSISIRDAGLESWKRENRLYEAWIAAAVS